MQKKSLSKWTIWVQKIADETSDKLLLSEKPKVVVNNTKRGYAYPHTGRITIPLWLYTLNNDQYTISYIIHEVVHFATGSKHDSVFKLLEEIMLERYELVPVYKKRRAYAHRLETLQGESVWEDDSLAA